MTAIIDSARLYLATLDEGLQGATRHGAPDRQDWGAVAHSLLVAQDEHRRRSALVASMTPEQRAALWADPSPEAAALRRLAREGTTAAQAVAVLLDAIDAIDHEGTKP